RRERSAQKRRQSTRSGKWSCGRLPPPARQPTCIVRRRRTSSQISLPFLCGLPRYAVGTVPVMSILVDLWRSARSFARTPALTLALVLSIAAGIGSTAVLQGFARGVAGRLRAVATERADAEVNAALGGDEVTPIAV